MLLCCIVTRKEKRVVNKNKRIAIIVSIVSAFALLLSGTYAWYKGASVLNELQGTKVEKDVILHDDFDPSTGNKDVYVENTGDETVYIRVRFDEYLDLYHNQVVDYDVLKYKIHKPKLVDEEYDASKSSETISFQDDEGVVKEYDFYNYFTWELGGSGKFYMSAMNQQATNGYYQNNTVFNGDEVGVKKMPDSQVITIDKYKSLLDAEKKAFDGWIYDLDGYAYYSKPLYKAQSTGLLLSHVTTNPSIIGNYDYFYGIHVDMEAVDYYDLGMWMEGRASILDDNKTYPVASADAKLFLEAISQDAVKTIHIKEAMIEPKRAGVPFALGSNDVLVIEVVFEDTTKSKITLTTGYTLSSEVLTVGKNQISVTYGGKTVMFEVNVAN